MADAGEAADNGSIPEEVEDKETKKEDEGGENESKYLEPEEAVEVGSQQGNRFIVRSLLWF